MPKPPRVWVVLDVKNGIPLDVFVARKIADESADCWRDMDECNKFKVVLYRRVDPTPRRRPGR